MIETASSCIKVILGLGNPGDEFAYTRHNVGALAVSEFSSKEHLSLRSDKDLKADVAKGVLFGKKVMLAVPRVYMNESGKAVYRIIRHVGSYELLVVVDDIETTFGKTDLVFAGGTRGHNGLKSIKNVLGSMNFTQLRIGVGRPAHQDVGSYVLSKFNHEEMENLPSVTNKALDLIQHWVVGE